MNKIYKVVWSKVKNCYVVVSEVAKANGKSGVKTIAAVTAAAILVSGGTALAAERVVNTGVADEPITEMFANLTASTGGAINNSGTLVVENSKFENNKATASGGAIYNTGTLTVTESEFTGNTTAMASGRPYGGAISNVGGTLTVEDSTFTNNGASGSKSAYGSVVYTSNGTTTISGSTFDSNTGGGSNGLIYATSGSKVTLADNTYTNNGRAIVNAAAGAEVVFEGTNTFEGNTTNDVLVRGDVTFAEGSKTVFDGDNTGADVGIYGTGEVVMEEGSTVTASNGIVGMEDSLLTINGGTLEIGADSTLDNLEGTDANIKFLDNVDLKIANNDADNLSLTALDTVTDASATVDALAKGQNMELKGIDLTVETDGTAFFNQDNTIKSDSDVTVNAGKTAFSLYGDQSIEAANVTINAGDDGIFSAGDENPDDVGNMTVKATGKVDITAEGGYAITNQSVNNGVVDITGKEVTLVSKDRGAVKSGHTEGTESNGVININGEKVTIEGATRTDKERYSAAVYTQSGTVNITGTDEINITDTTGNGSAILAVGGTTIVDGTADITVTGAVQAKSLPKDPTTLSLKGDDITITAKAAKASETDGAVRNASLEATGKVTIEADGLCGVGAGPDKETMAQSVNSIKANEIEINSTTAFGVYANNHSYHAVGTRVHSYLEADTINITSKKDGIYASNGAVTEVTGFSTLNVTSDEQGIGSEFGTMTFTGGDMTVTAAEEGIRSKLGGDLDFQVDTLKVDAGLESIKLTGDSVMNVDAQTAQLDGDITLEDNNYGTPELNIAFIGDDSYLNGNVTTSEGGVTNLTFAEGAQWTTKDSGASSVSDLTMDGGTINQNSTDKITIDNLAGEGNVVFKATDSGEINVMAAEAGARLNMSMAGTDADSFNTNDDLNKVANKLDAAADATANLTGNVHVDEGLLSGAIDMTVEYEDVDGDGLLNGVIKDVQQAATTTTTATIGGIAANAAVAWRDEDATLSQRLGELRESEGGQGVWARMTQGEFERGSDFETEYNTLQIGYDKAKGDWHYGAAVSHSEGDTVYGAGSGEIDSTSLSVYGTWLGEKGHYKDIVAKIGVINNEYTINAANQLTKGDYDTVGTSISGEYGMKQDIGSGWYVNPLAKMTYMHIGSADYTTNNGINVKHKSVDSLIARLGAELGKQIGEKGDIYIKASALHDFGGDADTILRRDAKSAIINDEIGGTWYEIGLGFNYKTSDATYLYADIIKTYGDEIRTPWQWNAGVRYSF